MLTRAIVAENAVLAHRRRSTRSRRTPTTKTSSAVGRWEGGWHPLARGSLGPTFITRSMPQGGEARTHPNVTRSPSRVRWHGRAPPALGSHLNRRARPSRVEHGGGRERTLRHDQPAPIDVVQEKLGDAEVVTA